jgi:hypothetical protein
MTSADAQGRSYDFALPSIIKSFDTGNNISLAVAIGAPQIVAAAAFLLFDFHKRV